MTPIVRPTAQQLRLADRDAASPMVGVHHDALREATEALSERMRTLQATLAADRRRALLVVLQGRDASGKDGAIRSVFGACNPAGVQVTAFGPPTPAELARDFLWRIHTAVPPKGMIGVFNRSHYEDVLVARVRGLVPPAVWKARYAQINAFEALLAASGTVVLKCLLHVSRDEQRQRLLERLEDPAKNWKWNDGDLADRAEWGAYTRAYRDVLRRCSTDRAPWYVVPADSKSARNYLVLRLVVETLERMALRYPPGDAAVLRAARRQLGDGS
ncbi:MAG: polyphosphate kinase 2 family protein [Gemmatimonadaceae bacterium]|nr:polyphosphate kinase 2 family protein [Gemmatimonadaceae bacterium]